MRLTMARDRTSAVLAVHALGRRFDFDLTPGG